MAETLVKRLADILQIRINRFLRHAEHSELVEKRRLGCSGDADGADLGDAVRRRSEERRVGKECS